jgi:hypothetical protein
MPVTMSIRNMLVMAFLGGALQFACAPAPRAEATPAPAQRGSPTSPAPSPPATPRCLRAGGICVGPAAIAASPNAPCPAGRHRVDDVAIVDPGPPKPACFGIPLGEEACCVPDEPGAR